MDDLTLFFLLVVDLWNWFRFRTWLAVWSPRSSCSCSPSSPTRHRCEAKSRRAKTSAPPPNNALRVIFNYLSRSIKRERYVGRYHIVDNQWASFNRDLVGNPVKLGKTEPDYGNKIFLRNSPAAKLPLLQGRLRFFFSGTHSVDRESVC